MKSLKKFVFAAFAVAILLGFASCSNNAGGGAGGTANSEPQHRHTFELTEENGIATKACSVCNTVLFTGPVLKSGSTYINADKSQNNDFLKAITDADATIGDDSNVERIVFGLLSDSSVKDAIGKSDVAATKRNIGKVEDTCYVYYDETSKTVYIVPADEDATKFVLNQNSSGLFYNMEKCTLIKGLDLLDTSNVTNMVRMFYKCQALTVLDVSGFDTSNVTNMASMFYKCQALTVLDVSKFDTSNVTNMYDMFMYCSALTVLDVSGFDTSNVTTMGEMFYECKALTSLDVSGFDTSKVTDMGNMFVFCSALTELDLSSFDYSAYTSRNARFFIDCDALTTIYVADAENVPEKLQAARDRDVKKATFVTKPK